MQSRKTILLTMIITLASVMHSYAEFVFLKDGTIIQGVISSDSASAVIIVDKEKKRQNVSRNNIMRILYTDLYLGKIYVQKTDGKNEICYMVDEDRDTYTFRRELYSPEEFTIRRDQVLFMARGNPTGLEGTADTDRLDLKWSSPYNPVKKYRLYIKEPGDTVFKTAEETGSKSCSLENLKSNTKYVFYVTAIDAEGNESLPSNELTISTLNIKPGKPGNMHYQIKRLKNGETVKGGSGSAADFITWGAVTDPDGVVKGYNIYYLRNGVEEKIGTVAGTEYEIPGDKSVYDIRIKAVDDRGDESPASRIRHSRAVKTGIQPVFFIPSGSLAEMFDPGFGVLIYFSEKNFLLSDLELGISMSAIKLPGSDKDKYTDMFLAPVTADAGYHIPVSEFLTVMPFISIGYTFMDVNYISVFENKNKKSWEPFVRAGAMLNFEFEDMQVSAGTDYGFISETSGMKPFFEIFLRAGMLVDL